MSIPIKRDYIEYLDALTLSQWKDKYNAYGLLKSLFENFQPIEDSLFDILNKRSLIVSEGVQLDVIGSLFNVNRAGREDEGYRQAIYEKISQQAYGVTIPNIVNVLRTASAASKVEVYEHPYGNIHTYMNVGPQKNLSNIHSAVAAAGIGNNVMFLPLDDSLSGENKGLAYHHSSPSNGVGEPYQFNGIGWNTNLTSVTNDTTIAPDSTLTADTITDDSTVQPEWVEYSGEIADNTEIDVSVFIKKDSSTVNDCLLQIVFSGDDADKSYGLQVAIDTGESQAFLPSASYVSPISYYVEDCVDYWFITFRASSTNHSTWTLSLYPCISTNLGALDATLTGSIVAWGASAYIDDGQYATQVSKDCLRLPIILREEYLVIDDVSDFIVDENLDNVLAISEGVNNPFNSQPLSIYHNIFNSQPSSVVI